MQQNDLLFLSLDTRKLIQNNTYEEIITGQSQPHSLQSIIAQHREISVGSRMTSRPYNWNRFVLSNSQIIATGIAQRYTGKDIADIYINSVQNNKHSYYPLTGNWTNTGIKQLVLFVKDNNLKKYLPYARFDIVQTFQESQMTEDQLKCITDITPICYVSYKTILEITNVQTDNLPDDYIGNHSADSIYTIAFTGSSPNLLMI